MKLGKFTIDIVETGLFGLDGGSMFGVVPKALWSRKYEEGDEKNRITLAAKPLLIQYEDKKIIVDTGNGTKYDEKFIGIYKVDVEKGNFNVALKPHGVKREDITDVILTHLHFDHAGGATIFENGEIAPTFPNAKYYVQKEQYEWGMNPTMKDKGSFIKNDFVPLKESGILELLDGIGELFPGIEVIPVDGHTKAMQMVKLKSKDKSLLYLADLCPTHAHLGIPFVMGYDNFPLTTIEEKKKYLGQAYEENSILVFEHDAFMQACTLQSTPKGFAIDEKITITD